MSTPPTIVDGTYEVLGPIGTGGMGEVFEARHRVTGRHVALKLLRAENAANEDARRRFVREAQAAGRLDHPHVVEILDAGIDAATGAPFLVQTLLRGVSLRRFVRARPRMDPALALRLLAPVLRGLAAAHAAGVVHRDMKPTNVILSRREGDAPGEVVPKIIDFGISKLHEDGGTHEAPSTITRSGVVIGTAAYMAPEQAEGRDDVDGRADLWAVGVMLYEMIVGRRPFEAPSTATLLLRIISHDPVPVAEARPDVPPAIADVVMRALRRDVAARWQTAAAMHAAIEEALGAPQRNTAVRVEGLDEVLASRESSVPPPQAALPSRAPTAETQPARRLTSATSAPPDPVASQSAVAPPRRSRAVAVVPITVLVVLALVAAGVWGATPFVASRPAPSPAGPLASVSTDAGHDAGHAADAGTTEGIDGGEAEAPPIPVEDDAGAPRVRPSVRRHRDAGASAPTAPPSSGDVRVGSRGAPILGAE